MAAAGSFPGGISAFCSVKRTGVSQRLDAPQSGYNVQAPGPTSARPRATAASTKAYS